MIICVIWKSYELESRSMVAGWNKIRESALKAIIEAAAIPLKQACVNCSSLASCQCGPLLSRLFPDVPQMCEFSSYPRKVGVCM